MMSKRWVLIHLMVLLGIVGVNACAQPGQYYDTGVSDEECVAIASRVPEAQYFLEKYPQAETLVDRSGTLAVDFRVSKHPVTNTTQLWEGIRLRVFLDPQTKKPSGMLLDCSGNILDDRIGEHLKQYFEIGKCQQ